MTLGFLAIAFAMVLAGLVALWSGSDPAMLSFGQTLMVLGGILVSGGFILAVLTLALRQLMAIRTLLQRASGEAPDAFEDAAEPALPHDSPASPAPESAAPAPAPQPDLVAPPPVATLTPPTPTPPMPVQSDLPPPPPRRVPNYMAAAAAGALGGAAAFSFGRKDKSEAPAAEDMPPTKDTSMDAAKPLPPRDDLEAMLVEVLGTGSRKAMPPAEPAEPLEPLELDVPALQLKGGEPAPERAETSEEPAETTATVEPLDLAPPELSPPAIAVPDMAPEPTEPEEPSLLREGVIASIPFRLYSDGSIMAQIEGEERSFATLKEFRDFVGG